VFHIILDQSPLPELENSIPNFVNVILVPPSFKPPKAMYKARALEYGRIAMNLGPEDWVLHLDEETQVDAFAVRACLDFVERGNRHFGMVTCRPSRSGIHQLTDARALSFTIVLRIGPVFSLPLAKSQESQKILVGFVSHSRRRSGLCWVMFTDHLS